MNPQPNPEQLDLARFHFAELVRTLRAHRIIIRLPYSSPLSLSSYAVKASLAIIVSDVNSISFGEFYLLTSTFSDLLYPIKEAENLRDQNIQFWDQLKRLDKELPDNIKRNPLAAYSRIETFFNSAIENCTKYNKVLLPYNKNFVVQTWGWLTCAPSCHRSDPCILC